MSQLYNIQQLLSNSFFGNIKYNTEIAENRKDYVENINNLYFSIPSFKQITRPITLYKKIDSFALLKVNWDSYDADIISITAILTAKKVLEFLYAQNFIFDEFEINVFPMRDGGIQFEFDKKDASSELEIDPEGKMQFIRYDQEGTILKTVSLPDYDLSDLLDLMEGTENG